MSFPIKCPKCGEDLKAEWIPEQPTLRDQFAMNIASGFIVKPQIFDSAEEQHEYVARQSYGLADAMIRERNVTNKLP